MLLCFSSIRRISFDGKYVTLSPPNGGFKEAKQKEQ